MPLFFSMALCHIIHRMTDARKPQSSDKYIIRFPDGMRDQIADAARKNGRSMNAEIVQRLEHSFTPWKERPWEERMVIDVDRAMLKLLTKDEYSMLLDRVEAAGGADTVNGYAPTVIRSADDLKPPIPDGPRLMEVASNSSPTESEKDATATQLALKVLEVFGNARDRAQANRWKAQIESKQASDKAAPPRPLDADTPGRTSASPVTPGVNAPKEGLGGAPKQQEEPRRRFRNSRAHIKD